MDIVDFQRTQFVVDFRLRPGRCAGTAAPTIRSSLPTRTCSTPSLPARLGPTRWRRSRRDSATRAPFTGVRVIDEQTLRCAYADGTEPYLLHHYLVQAVAGAHAPWRLLAAAATAADRHATGDPRARKAIPRRLRSGPAAYVERAWNAREQVRYRLLDADRRAPPRPPRTAIDGAPMSCRRLLLRRRRALLPRRGGDDQLAAPHRPRRADLPARLRAQPTTSASCSPPR